MKFVTNYVRNKLLAFCHRNSKLDIIGTAIRVLGSEYPGGRLIVHIGDLISEFSQSIYSGSRNIILVPSIRTSDGDTAKGDIHLSGVTVGSVATGGAVVILIRGLIKDDDGGRATILDDGIELI